MGREGQEALWGCQEFLLPLPLKENMFTANLILPCSCHTLPW